MLEDSGTTENSEEKYFKSKTLLFVIAKLSINWKNRIDIFRLARLKTAVLCTLFQNVNRGYVPPKCERGRHGTQEARRPSQEKNKEKIQKDVEGRSEDGCCAAESN